MVHEIFFLLGDLFNDIFALQWLCKLVSFQAKHNMHAFNITGIVSCCIAFALTFIATLTPGWIAMTYKGSSLTAGLISSCVQGLFVAPGKYNSDFLCFGFQSISTFI